MEWEPGATWLVVRILVKGTSHDSSHPPSFLKIVSGFTSKEEVREFESGKRPFSNPFLSMAGIILEREAGDSGVVRSLPLKQASQQTQMHAI